jgi:hypothetical protein
MARAQQKSGPQAPFFDMALRFRRGSPVARQLGSSRRRGMSSCGVTVWRSIIR